MPAVSKAQYRYIKGVRERYGSEKATPDADKWVWGSEWVDGVDYAELPKHAPKEKSAFHKLAADRFVQHIDSPKYFGRQGGKINANMILQASQKHGVDARLLAAILANESGYGANSRAVTHNNFGGMMGGGKDLFTYQTPQDGIDAVAANLKKRYVSQGLTTPAQIGPKYAPTVAATNDPRGINKGWVPTVSSIYAKIPAPTGSGVAPEKPAPGTYQNPLLVKGRLAEPGTPQNPLLVKGKLAAPGTPQNPLLVKGKLPPQYSEPADGVTKASAHYAALAKSAGLTAAQLHALHTDLSKVMPVITQSTSFPGVVRALKELNLNNWFDPRDIVPTVVKRYPEIGTAIGPKAKVGDLMRWVNTQRRILPKPPAPPAPPLSFDPPP